jgi:hypothetical protein
LWARFFHRAGNTIALPRHQRSDQIRGQNVESVLTFALF